MKKIICLLLFAAQVAMGQNLKISEMPAASSLTGSELVPVVQSGVNKKATVSQFVSGYVPTTRTITINGTTFDLSANRTWSVGNVFTSGTYSNPSWITSLNAGKITGTLSVLQGGSGATTLTGILQGNGTSAFTAIDGTGSPGQFLRRNAGDTGYEFGTVDLSTKWDLTTASTQSFTNNLTFQGSSTNLLTFNFPTLGDNQGVTVNSTATGASASSTTQAALKVTNSGANANSFVTSYAGYFSNTKTGTGAVNNGIYSEASGGSSNNAGIFHGKVGINTNTPGSSANTSIYLDISGNAIELGSDLTLSSRTNNTNKIGVFVVPHYTNASIPFIGLYGSSTSTDNSVAFGGGTNAFNSATRILFFTGATQTTTGGTERAGINSSGNMLIGGAVSGITANTRLDVRGIGTTTANIFRLANSSNTERYTLNDQGDATLTGKLTINNNASVAGTSLIVNNSTSTDDILKIQDNGTDVVTVRDGGLMTIGTPVLTASKLNSSLSSASSSGSILNGIFYSDQTVGTTGSIQGLEGYNKTSNATGTVTLSIGTIGNSEHSGAGTVDFVRGIQGGGIISGNGTVNNWVGLYSQPLAITGTGIATNVYGAYLDTPSAGSGTITNRYGLWSNDGSAINHFAGTVNLNGLLTLNSSAGTSGQVLTSQGSGSDPIWTTPSSGITNSAANNELMKSNGTNAVASGLFVSNNGSIDMGSASIAGGRQINVLSSATDAELDISTKGTGRFRVTAGETDVNVSSTSTNTSHNAIDITRNVTGASGSNNVGASINYYIENDAGSVVQKSAEQRIYLVNAADLSQTAEVEWRLVWTDINDQAAFKITAGSGTTTTAVTSSSNTIQTGQTLFSHRDGGTAGNGFGLKSSVILENASDNDIEATKEETVWIDATNGSEDADKVFYTIGAGTLAERVRITSDGRLYGTAIHNNSGSVTGTTNQYIASGTFTPTLSNGTNVAASTAYACQWIRVGNVVTFSGRFDLDITSTGLSILTMSLPIASNFTDTTNGGFTAANSSGDVMYGYGHVANDVISFEGTLTELTNVAWFFSGTYLIK